MSSSSFFAPLLSSSLSILLYFCEGVIVTSCKYLLASIRLLESYTVASAHRPPFQDFSSSLLYRHFSKCLLQPPSGLLRHFLLLLPPPLYIRRTRKPMLPCIGYGSLAIALVVAYKRLGTGVQPGTPFVLLREFGCRYNSHWIPE